MNNRNVLLMGLVAGLAINPTTLILLWQMLPLGMCLLFLTLIVAGLTYLVLAWRGLPD